VEEGGEEGWEWWVHVFSFGVCAGGGRREEGKKGRREGGMEGNGGRKTDTVDLSSLHRGRVNPGGRRVSKYGSVFVWVPQSTLL